MARHDISVFAITLLVAAINATTIQAQPAVISVSFRNVLRQGGIVIRLEQLDTQRVVVALVQQRLENRAIATFAISRGTRFNIRVLPDLGGGHVFPDRDIVADSKDNEDRPIDLDGKFDPDTGRRYAVALRVGTSEILAPTIDYPAPESRPAPKDRCLPPSPAIIVVRLPHAAKLTIHGRPTSSTGTQRSYRSPPLAQGVIYFYTLKASLSVDGKVFELARRVHVQAGQLTNVSFEESETVP